jgi:hypothetical protein
VPGEPPPRRRRVRRGEGEVTEWPRGLVSYVARGPVDATPDPEEDRLVNRARLAGRLIALLDARGHPTAGAVAELRRVDAELRDGDRASAAQRLDRLLGELDRRAGRP